MYQSNMRSRHRRAKAVSWIVIAVMAVVCLFPVSVSAAAADPAKVTVSFQADDTGFLLARQSVSVTPGLAKDYGYSYDASVKATDITALDALVAAHILKYGNDETAINNALVDSGGWFTKVMDIDGSMLYYVNGEQPNDGVAVTDDWGTNYTGYAINKATLAAGDVVEFFMLQDTSFYSDAYAWFEQVGVKTEAISATVDEELHLTLQGYVAMFYGLNPPNILASYIEAIEDAAIVPVTVNSGIGTFGSVLDTTDEDGKFTLLFNTAGTYIVSAFDDSGYDLPFAAPWLEVTVYSEAAKDVLDQIIALPANVTLTDKAKVTSARAAYNALSKRQKAEVSADYLPILLAAEYRINALEQKHSTTFDANGGTIASGVSKTTVTTNESYGNFPTVTKTGHSLVGWFTAKTGGTEVKAGSNVSQTADHTLYAQWKPNQYKLAFDANGGKVTTKSKTVSYGTAYDKLPTPTKSLKDFKGWYTQKSGGVKVAAATTLNSANDVTVYAQWKNKKASVIKVKSLNIKKTKSSKSKTLKSAKKGAKVEVLSKSGKWYKVKYKKKTGWVPVKNLKLL